MVMKYLPWLSLGSSIFGLFTVALEVFCLWKPGWDEERRDAVLENDAYCDSIVFYVYFFLFNLYFYSRQISQQILCL